MNALTPLLLVALQGAQPASQEGIRAAVRMEPDTVRVGQRATLTLSLTGVPGDAEVVFPVPADSATTVAIGPPRTRARTGDERTADYELIAWSPGDLTVDLGEVRIVAADRDVRLSSPSARLHVASVLPPGADPDTLAWRPPGEVVGPNWSLAEKAAAVALAIALLALTGIYVLRRGRPEPLPQPLPRPAKERALEALDRLVDTELLAAREYKAFHAELSHVLRAFLAETDRRWGLDLTTGEILTATRGGGLDPARAHTLIEILAAADLIKFARMTSSPERALQVLGNARVWVERFERVPVATSAEAPRNVEAEPPALADATAMDDLFAALDDENENGEGGSGHVAGGGRREERGEP